MIENVNSVNAGNMNRNSYLAFLQTSSFFGSYETGRTCCLKVSCNGSTNARKPKKNKIKTKNERHKIIMYAST